MLPSGWKTVTLDYDRASEGFTDEDVDRFTELVDMKGHYEFILVLIPTLSAEGAVSVCVQNDEKIATNPFAVHAFDADATGSFLHATSSGAGGIAAIFRIGGAQWLRLYVAADQTANRVFKVLGFNRAPS